MKAIVCEMCGSHDLIKQSGMYVCQNCGTKYDPEEAKKLLVEVSGTVKVDNKEKLENYYTLARRARDSNNAPDAAKYYDLIRAEDPNDWEATFFSVYYQAIQTRVMNVKSYTDMLYEAAVTSIAIAATKLDQDEASSAISLIFLYVNQFAEAAFETCEKGYNDSWPNVSKDYIEEHFTRIVNLFLKLIGLGNGCYTSFGDKPDLKKLCLFPYKKAIELAARFDSNTHHIISFDLIKPVVEIIPRVQEFEPSFQPPNFTAKATSAQNESSSGLLKYIIYLVIFAVVLFLCLVEYA